MIVYLHLRKRRLPRALMAILDMEPDEVPLPARRWWQVLIRHYLFGTKWAESEARDEHRRALAGRLRKDGLLHRRELRIEESRPVRESLSLSPSKIDACLRIHDLERRLRGEALRQVILTDFIRDDDGNDERPASVRKLGAWTIFRALAAESPGAEDLGLVTGRLVALPSSRVEQLEEALGEAAGKIQAEPLPGLPGFVRVSGPPLVDAMTDLLTRGALRVMVGTRALLGEGWDAPAINSLVLASYVGSFMLTNQMRGRAIRIDPAVPDKTSSIWHIVAVVPGTESGLSDHADLERRFRTFAGLAAGRPAIESGLDRLAMPDPGGAAWIQSVQTEMGERAERRDELGSRWKEAIESGETGRILPSVRLERPPPIRAFKFRNTLKYLLASALAALLGGCSWLLQGSAGLGNWRYVLGLGLAGALLGLIVALPKLLKALWALIRYLPVDGSIRQISLALLHALRRTDLIETPRRSLRIRVRELDGGGFSVALEGATFYEQSLFADSLEQILGAIRNPRYLVTRPGTGGRRRRIDYHAVPHQLGVNKERAETFLAEWARRIGDGRLIYTRNPEGRAELLKARVRAFSSHFVEDVERLDRWQ